VYRTLGCTPRGRSRREAHELVLDTERWRATAAFTLRNVLGESPSHQSHMGRRQHRPIGFVPIYQLRALSLILSYTCKEPPNQPSRLSSRPGLNLIAHLRLGNRRQSLEFDVLVLFLGMAHASRTTSFLKKDEHCLWVNRFLLLAIREVCPQDVIQYHPQSFDNAESKTYSRRRENCSGKVCNNMDMHHYLPLEYLEDIWRHIT
jgi:hypothetical protein